MKVLKFGGTSVVFVDLMKKYNRKVCDCTPFYFLCDFYGRFMKNHYLCNVF